MIQIPEVIKRLKRPSSGTVVHLIQDSILKNAFYIRITDEYKLPITIMYLNDFKKGIKTIEADSFYIQPETIKSASIKSRIKEKLEEFKLKYFEHFGHIFVISNLQKYNLNFEMELYKDKKEIYLHTAHSLKLGIKKNFAENHLLCSSEYMEGSDNPFLLKALLDSQLSISKLPFAQIFENNSIDIDSFDDNCLLTLNFYPIKHGETLENCFSREFFLTEEICLQIFEYLENGYTLESYKQPYLVLRNEDGEKFSLYIPLYSENNGEVYTNFFSLSNEDFIKILIRDSSKIKGHNETKLLLQIKNL